jgi:aminodeoxyfutalosine synthase
MDMTAHAEALLSTRDLIAVGVQGDDVRRRMHGARTTFVRVFDVHVEAVPDTLPPSIAAGEFRLVGRPASVEAVCTAVDAVAALVEGLAQDRNALSWPTSGFSLSDVRALAPDLAGLTTLCRRLRDHGLEAIAEVPLDLLEDPAEWVLAARDGGLVVNRLTVHALADDQRIPILERARDLQAAVGGFRVFAPLPRTMSVTAPTTGYDDVKQVALARLVVANIESIQVDWPLYGPKLAQVALTVGADDVDGIAAVDPGVLGTRRSPIEEIKGNIRAAGLEAVERDGRFRPLA